MKYYAYDYTHLENQFSNYYIIKPIHELVYKDDNSGKEAYDESGEPIFADEYIAIDLDELEKAQSKQRVNKQLLSSMDMALAIADTQQNIRFVLIEYRFNFKDFSNITKEKLDDKVACSSECITSLFRETVHDQQYFVFAYNKVQQGRNRLNRMNPRCSPNYRACGVQDLYDIFF